MYINIVKPYRIDIDSIVDEITAYWDAPYYKDNIRYIIWDYLTDDECYNITLCQMEEIYNAVVGELISRKYEVKASTTSNGQ